MSRLEPSQSVLGSHREEGPLIKPRGGLDRSWLQSSRLGSRKEEGLLTKSGRGIGSVCPNSACLNSRAA